jgi:hypothetical protein
MGLKEDALADIDAVLAMTTAAGLEGSTERITHLHACITRYARTNSSYRTQADKFIGASANPNVLSYAINGLVGTLKSLRTDVANGHLRQFESLVRADVLADLLAQADELVHSGYRLPAAVLAGAALEEHIRKLAAVNAVPTHGPDGRPRQASALNADLYSKANVYSKAENAQVDAWQKLRNEAAHGLPTFMTTTNDSDIARMISGIRDFVVKYPG